MSLFFMLFKIFSKMFARLKENVYLCSRLTYWKNGNICEWGFHVPHAGRYSLRFLKCK